MKRTTKLLAKVICTVSCALALTGTLCGCSIIEGESYTPPELTPTLAPPTISETGVLKVGVNSENPPLAGKSSDGSKIVGFDVDFAAAIADELGLKVQIVDVGSDAESALAAGTIDIALGLDKSDTGLSCWLSDAYLSSGVALFSQNATGVLPSNTAETTIAAQVSTKSAWAIVNEYDKATLNPTDDLEGAFSALESGQVQYVASDALIGSYVVRNTGATAVLVAMVQEPSGFAVGVLDGNSELKQAVSNVLTTLKSNGMISLLETKWLGAPIDVTSLPVAATTNASDESTDSTDEEASEETSSDSADESATA